MTQVYLGIGSNIDRETNIHGGLNALKSRYGKLQTSPIYESRAYGFDGDDFYNLVVSFDTDRDVESLEKELREIEYQFGRQRNEERFSSRTLDIDLLLFGDLVCDKHELPRADITEYEGRFYPSNIDMIRHTLKEFRPIIHNQNDSVYYKKVRAWCHNKLGCDPSLDLCITANNYNGSDVT